MALRTRMLAWQVRTLSTAKYWRSRTRANQVRGTSAFAVSQSAVYLRESRSMAWLLIKSLGRVIVTVAVAVAVVAGVQALGMNLQVIARWGSAPAWLSGVSSWLGSPPSPDMNYQAIVTAALAVTGALASVYFATVTFVMSTTYKDATSGVRALVTRLPGGRVYTSVFVQAVLFGLITLTLPLTGQQPNRLLLCVLTILGGFVVLSFGRLRTQLYGLLEPVALLPVVQRDLVRWMRQARRLPGRDPTRFRTHLCRTRTLQSLTALRDLCYLIRDRERTSNTVPAEYAGTDPRVLSAARYVQAIWRQYARCKHVLIQSPGWCSQRDRHKDWLLASEHETSIALATATTLQPATSDDALWFERHLAAILGELVGGREVPQLASILNSLDDPVRELMARGMFAESRLWMDATVTPARTATTETPQPSATTAGSGASTQAHIGPATGTAGLAAHRYNLVDFVALTYTLAVLGLHDYAHALATDLPQWAVAQADGKNVRHLGPIPAELLSNIQDAIKFEKAIEGRRVTSDANIRQLVARAVATETIDEATALMAIFEDEFWPWANHVADGEALAAGAALSRFDEALHKWELPLATLGTLFAECEAVHRDVDDRWPDLNLDGLAARRAALQDQLRAPIAQVAIQVDADLNPDRPDVFGWAFYRTHQDLLDDVLSERTPAPPDLDKRLRALVVATDRASGRLHTTRRRHHHHVLGSIWSEPMLMLLQLSGIALVIGLARQRSDVLQVFERVWNERIGTSAQSVLNRALAALRLDDSLFGLSSGKVSRSSRQVQALDALEKGGLSRDVLEFGDIEDAHPAIDPKLAAMLRHVGFDGFEEVFVAAWLIPAARERGATLPDYDLGHRLTGLVESLADNADDPQAGTHNEPDQPVAGRDRTERD